MTLAARTLSRWLVWSMLATRGASAARARRLSRSDHKYWHGQLAPANASVGSIPKKFVFIHIPKAAGDSFMHDAPAHMPGGSTLVGSHETSALSSTTLRRMGKTGVRVGIFRHPVRLAFSQFVFCKYVMPKTSKEFPRAARRATGRQQRVAGPTRGSATSTTCARRTASTATTRATSSTAAATRCVAIGPSRPEADAARARAPARAENPGRRRRRGARETMCLFRYWTTRAPACNRCHAPAAAAGARSRPNITHNTPGHSTARPSPRSSRACRALPTRCTRTRTCATRSRAPSSGYGAGSPEARGAWAACRHLRPDTPRDVARAAVLARAHGSHENAACWQM